MPLAERDCDAPLPHQASHGQWLLAWNDNPDDDTAVFVRKQSSAETSISDYDTPLSDVLAHQLRLQLQGNAEALPVLEVPAAQPSDIVTLFYSGDGGWRDLDKDSAEHMASMATRWSASTPCATTGNTRARNRAPPTSPS